MSKFTTGEVAKLCSIFVRTVQYYDNRGILSPSELREDGRRLYSEEDLAKMKIVCFLRELDLPLETIADLLREAPSDVIALLLEEQEKLLKEEIAQKEEKLEKLSELRNALKQAFFAAHTPMTRKLTCTACGHRRLCVETFDKNA